MDKNNGLPPESREAMEIRPRFTILRYDAQIDFLKETASSITSFYFK
jgi:hypothetical protein